MTALIPARWLLWPGVVGPIGFVVTFTVEGAVRPGYDPVRHFVSLLSLGDGGWLQVVNFLVTGGLIAAFGVALRARWVTGRGSRWVPRLIVATGVALIASGIFATDPGLGYPPGAPDGMPTDPSWHAGLHYLGSVVVFLALPAAMFLTARRFRTGGDTAAAAYSVVSALIMVGFWIAPFVLEVAGPSQVAGLLQRIAVLGGFQWLVAIALAELGILARLPVRAAA
ncbi:MAG: DUF998 domain-containing protein [Chloroflexi bacterium]|nr:DUF998 domain-containing protein [Chloroflexota bacterium]